MTDEKLIDALAKIQCAIEGRTHGFSLDEVVAPGIERWTRHRYEAEILLRDIRESGYVFEKAQSQAKQNRGGDLVIAPDCDEREALHLIEQAESFREQTKADPDAQPNSMVGLWLRTASALEAALRRTVVQEPQGEPSDAQVTMFMRDLWPLTRDRIELDRTDPWTADRIRDALRAALRAAGEVQP